MGDNNTTALDQTYRLADLIDLTAVQKMADSHYKATGIPIGLIDAFDNSVLVGAGWQDICLLFHRANSDTLKRCVESDNFIKANLNEHTPSRYKCLNGLWDIGMPIIVAGQHLGTLFLGQFFYEGEVPDRQFFLDQASKYSFDQQQYLDALDQVPVFTRDKVQTVLEYDVALIRFIEDLAEKKLLQKQGEEERTTLELRLQQVEKMDAIGQMAGGIAHDFNNMLGGIVGAAEMLAPHLPDEPRAKKYHQMILDTADRAAGLVGKLLTFSSSTPQASSLVDVHRVIKEALVLLENTIDPRIIVEINLAAEQAAVVGDLSQLQNAFLNLGINGSHAMPNGGTLSMISRNLELEASDCEHSIFDLDPGKYLEIDVQDTGSGIPPEHLNKIFDPFFTTKAHLGTGLGLATVYGAVQQHHGAISVVSELGAGTTFQILLPLATDEQFMSTSSPTTHKGDGGKVLVVDDEDMMRLTTEAMLEDLGYEVLLAEDGQKALNIFQEQSGSIDLVLLDMLMPVMSGKDCFIAMKQFDPEVRVVLSSGFTREEDLLQMQKLGLKGFLRKPYRVADLSQAIHEALK